MKAWILIAAMISGNGALANESAQTLITFEASKYDILSYMEHQVSHAKTALEVVLQEFDCNSYDALYRNLKSSIKESGALNAKKTLYIQTKTACPNIQTIVGHQTNFAVWVWESNEYSFTAVDRSGKTRTIKTSEKTVLN